ncbi:glucose-6-phosphate dehydrogenase [Sphingobium sp. YR768]|uniref:glucose-6-phosphate dehydrogenase n=1 Tax=Sphingobium sp. YR768 TaxID=1884365 RepID=UPI0008B5639D|nr:glucose-6-phosphate dehydrogenase [Sphingobium sp. YR768]SES19036.1 glucose-6-phosphate 1-dehydrogenase [Sphingobium sp. YR768]
MRQVAGKLLLFGATGDLAQRMLLPSLYGLHADGLLPEKLTITATSHLDMDEEGYRRFAAAALSSFVAPGRKCALAVSGFLDRLHYSTLDATDPDGFGQLSEKVGSTDEGLAIFLSTAPWLFGPTIKGLKTAGLAGDGVRIGLEKPLGNDLASSREINDIILDAFPEDRTFRVDHYLGKETVQNILALRFGNSLFEPVWNAQGIDHVQITVSETVGLEGRAGYYDKVGSLRDMVQNHMLQLLALIAMEPPARFNGAAIRDEKVKVLRSLRQICARDVATHTVTGQYQPGAIDGEIVAGYAQELDCPSDTETFVAIKAHVDNWRWRGVPFYLRTGKRLPERRSEIVVRLKPVSHSIFEERGASLCPNTLVIRLQPQEYVRFLVMAKQPGLDREGVRLQEVPLNLSLDDQFAQSPRRIAYERLLLDLIDGDPTLFVRRDEIEAQWEWVDAIREGWKAHDVRPKPYAAGAWGPSAAIALTERDGITWHE